MELLITAFLLGLVGSLHCAGMCGPIALSLPLRGNSIWQKLSGGILYNVGKAIMYGLMGAAFGFIGQGFKLLGFQRWVSLVAGVLLILSVLFPIIFKNANIPVLDTFTGKVRNAIARLFSVRSYGGLFLIGALNSLLPCGLVYFALAGAIATGGSLSGALFMVVFGLGTLPMLLSIAMVGNLITFSVRERMNRIVPYVVVFMGALFVMRGLCLGIPYISPAESKLTIPVQQSATQPECHTQPEGGCCSHKK